MIRDPSDGSVKEKPKVEMTTALPPNPIDAKEAAKLERSRAWVKDYHANKVMRSPKSGEGNGSRESGES